MKTMKLFIATAVVLLFAVEIANAQQLIGNKKVWTQTFPAGFIMPCAEVEEWVEGEETYTVTLYDNATKLQRRCKGTYTGVITGKTYTWSDLENINWDSNNLGAWSPIQVVTQSVECEGVPILVYKYRYHITWSAGREVPSVEFERGSFECL